MDIQTIFMIIVLIISAIIHEYMHGWTAERLGDPTARLAGRLTLNPISHIDLWGSIIIPLFLIVSGAGFIIGWAKPVPYNPFNLKDKKWGPAMVAAAGPLTNLFIAVCFGVIIRLTDLGTLDIFLASIVYINILLAFFNLVPLPPLDGSKILFALFPSTLPFWRLRVQLERLGMILVFVFVFFFWFLIQPLITAVFRLLVG